MSHELADITTCMVPVPLPGVPGSYKPCGQKFTSHRVPIIGEDKNARLHKYLSGLAKHLSEKHPDLGLQMAQHGAAFMEMLFLRNFKTTDPELSEQQDRVRWQVHQQTLKARYPDENIDLQAYDLADRLLINLVDAESATGIGREKLEDRLRREFAELLVEAFTSIRDALEEPNKYAPPSPVV